jgi:hypothetical protein
VLGGVGVSARAELGSVLGRRRGQCWGGGGVGVGANLGSVAGGIGVGVRAQVGAQVGSVSGRRWGRYQDGGGNNAQCLAEELAHVFEPAISAAGTPISGHGQYSREHLASPRFSTTRRALMNWRRERFLTTTRPFPTPRTPLQPSELAMIITFAVVYSRHSVAPTPQ